MNHFVAMLDVDDVAATTIGRRNRAREFEASGLVIRRVRALALVGRAARE